MTFSRFAQSYPIPGVEYACKFLSELEASKHTLDAPVLVYLDPDVDGLIAGKLWVDYLKSRGIPYETYMNDFRQHGFLVPSERFEGRTILSGDFSVSFNTLHRLSAQKGTRWLHTDHHNSTEAGYFVSSDNSVVSLNPQYGTHSLSAFLDFQSGAGVVWQVLSYYDPEQFDTSFYHALVGITLLSDIRPLPPQSRPFLSALYSAPYEGYLRYLIDTTYLASPDYGFGTPEWNRHFVDYKFSPLVNATLRLNRGETAIRLILQEIDHSDVQFLKVSLSRQKDFVKASSSFSVTASQPGGTLLLFDQDDCPVEYLPVLPASLGYLASRVQNSSSTLAIYHRKGIVFRASFRGQYDDVDYRSILQEYTGVPCEGHSIAFGVKVDQITPEFLSNFRKFLNDPRLKPKDSDNLKVVSTDNLLSEDPLSVAKENQFLINRDKTYIHYTGGHSLVRETDKFQRYVCNGAVVLSFNGKNPTETLLAPVYDRGTVTFTTTDFPI